MLLHLRIFLLSIQKTYSLTLENDLVVKKIYILRFLKNILRTVVFKMFYHYDG